MTEEKFKELLLENNKNTEEKFKELLLENNKSLVADMDTKMKRMIQENNKILVANIDKKIECVDRRINGKLAVLEQKYGEKISAIFDKLEAIDERMTRKDEENQKYIKMIEYHDTLLYSQDVRISKLEKKVSSI